VHRECDAGEVTPRTDLDALRDAFAEERTRMVQQIADLERRFDDIVTAAELTSTDDEHDPEGATIAYERAQVWALLQQARHDLAAIDEAAPALADGALPICQGCGGPIGADRTCIRCAS
jgi:DnaK suppressor protein